MSGPSSDLKSRVLAQARASSAVTRPVQRRRALLALVLVLASTAAIMRLHGARGLAVRPSASTALLCAVFLAVVLWLGRPVLAYRSSPLGAASGRSARRAWLTPIWLALGVWLIDAVLPGVREPLLGASAHVRCASLTLGGGVAIACVVIALLRGSVPVASRALGAWIGACAGTTAAFAVSMSCAHVEAGHVIGTHVATVSLITLLTATLGARVLRSPEPSGR